MRSRKFVKKNQQWQRGNSLIEDTGKIGCAKKRAGHPTPLDVLSVSCGRGEYPRWPRRTVSRPSSCAGHPDGSGIPSPPDQRTEQGRPRTAPATLDAYPISYRPSRWWNRRVLGAPATAAPRLPPAPAGCWPASPAVPLLHPRFFSRLLVNAQYGSRGLESQGYSSLRISDFGAPTRVFGKPPDRGARAWREERGAPCGARCGERAPRAGSPRSGSPPADRRCGR